MSEDFAMMRMDLSRLNTILDLLHQAMTLTESLHLNTDKAIDYHHHMWSSLEEAEMKVFAVLKLYEAHKETNGEEDNIDS